MWICQSHTLAPLTALSSKTVKWQWTDVKQNAFDEMKKIISRETLLTYPNFHLPFEIHTDASHTQFGLVILQQKRPIAFYSRKLNPAQMRYTTTERELLSIVETLKEFRKYPVGPTDQDLYGPSESYLQELQYRRTRDALAVNHRRIWTNVCLHQRVQ
jgi:hypothetical protein